VAPVRGGSDAGILSRIGGSMSMARIAEVLETEADLMTCGVAVAANATTKPVDLRMRILVYCY